VKVRKHEDGIDTTDVHSEDFYSESSIVKHFFTEFNNESGLGDIVSTKKETR
jgi:hypothetical protein